MAKFFKSIGQLFGLSSGDKSQSEGYGGPSPQPLNTFEPYKLSTDEKLARLKSKQYGLSADYLKEATNPYATELRSNLKNYTLPTIYNQASARGLGRSSLVTSQVAQKGQEAEMDIAERLANLKLQNEANKYNQQIADEAALNTAGLQASDQQNNIANFSYQDYQRVMGARADQSAADLAGVGRGLTLATALAGGVLGGGAGRGMAGASVGALAGGLMGSMIFGGGGTSGQSSQDLMGMLNLLKGSTPTQVNTGTSNYSIMGKANPADLALASKNIAW